MATGGDYRVGLITTNPEVICGEERDLPIIVPALEAVGVEAVPLIWHDASVNWAPYDLLVMRSPWDYPERLQEFRAWLDARSAEVPVLNCRETILWNLDKAYLKELEARGVAIVPTTLCDSRSEVEEAIGTAPSRRVVIKPNISVGSRDTGLFDLGDAEALQLAQRIIDSGRRALVQPAVDGVADIGEHSLVSFDGDYSHAFTKGPILALGGGFLGGTYTENITSADASDAEIELARAATKAISEVVQSHGCTCANSTPLYTRFDIVMSTEGPQLLEAEMFEPSYFLETAPGAERRFAAAVRGRLTASSAR